MTILVVDDEVGIRKIICAVLKRAGYTCLEATGADDALSKLTDEVALVLTDLVMPDTDGLGLAKQMRERYPDLPILLMSGYNTIEGLHEFRCLEKPFASSKVILDAVREAIESRSSTISLTGGEDIRDDVSLEEMRAKVKQARAAWLDAIKVMDEAIADVPTGIPHPDGTLRIQMAGTARAAAFQKYRRLLLLLIQMESKPSREIDQDGAFGN